MNRYTITTLCLALWYMCVLLTWVHFGQSMHLFGDFTAHGWLMIASAFVGSLALNFVLNPLIWITAACYIKEARQENRKSRWEIYPGLVGVVILSSILSALFRHVPLTMKDGDDLSVVSNAPAAQKRPSIKAPKVSGIMFAQGEPKALIDGYVLKEGEEINGFTVDQISETSVTFIAPDGSEVQRRVK